MITFPQNCNNRIATYKRIFSDYWNVLETEYVKEIVFECGNICFIRPLGLNVIALLIRSFLQQGTRTIFFVSPNNAGCERYFQDQGFYKEFHIEAHEKTITASPRSTSVGLRRMETFEPLYLDTIAVWLNKNLLLPEESIKDAVNIPLSEIINNVIDHSRSPLGCYISAQAYPHEDRLLFSVADLGVGFLQTLRPEFPQLRENRSAIALAIKYGVSSKSKGRNVGAGLSILSDFLRFRGKLEIISFDGVWRQGFQGNSVTDTLPFSFPGSCINIEFDNQKIAELVLGHDA